MNEITCPKCGGFAPGHATGAADICECEPIYTGNRNPTTLEQVSLSKLKLQQELANMRTQNLLMLATLHELIATVERMTEQVRGVLEKGKY